MGRHVNERPRRLKKILHRVATKPFNVHRHLLMRKMQLAINATPSEKRARKLLAELGYRYQFQKGFIAGGVMYVADFYIPKPHKLIIEIDGGYHNDTVQKWKDGERDAYFRSRGMKVLRIKNEHIEKMTVEQLNDLIQLYT